MMIFSSAIVIAVVILFVYIILLLLFRDFKNKKLKESVLSGGENTDGIITNIHSRSGGNSGFINITLHYYYTIEDGRTIDARFDGVIDAMDIYKYQPGEKLNLRYSKKEPEKVVVNIKNPMLKEKKK